MNVMQLMNGIYNIFKYLDYQVLRNIWDHANSILHKNEPFHAITNPLLNRWWLVGYTVCDLDKFWEIWQTMMVGLVNLPKSKTDKKNSGKVIWDISAANNNLMTFPEIKCDAKFIAAVHTFFVFPHFSFFRAATGQPLTRMDTSCA